MYNKSALADAVIICIQFKARKGRYLPFFCDLGYFNRNVKPAHSAVSDRLGRVCGVLSFMYAPFDT